MLRPQINNKYFHSLYDSSAEFGIPIEGHHTGQSPLATRCGRAVLAVADQSSCLRH